MLGAGDADSVAHAGPVHGEPHYLETARRGAQDGEGGGAGKEGGVIAGEERGGATAEAA